MIGGGLGAEVEGLGGLGEVFGTGFLFRNSASGVVIGIRRACWWARMKVLGASWWFGVL